MGICWIKRDEAIITDTHNGGFTRDLCVINVKYNKNQLYYKTLCANRDVSIIWKGVFLQIKACALANGFYR